MIKFLALFALFAMSAAHAECINKYGAEYCVKETPPPRCITSDGKEFCQKDSPSAVPAIQLPQAVYVQPLYPPVYYGYPYYAPVGVGFVFRFGGNHYRH